jgi:hypothetical protein
MIIETDWTQSSTFRGAVRIAVLVIGLVGWWMGKDVTGIILLGTGINGILGVVTKDK